MGKTKQRKNVAAGILLCVICAAAYVLSLLGLTDFFVLLGGGELSQDFCDAALQCMLYGGVCGGVVLGVLSVVLALWSGVKGRPASRKVVAAVKIALAPCYIVALAVWVPIWANAIDLTASSFGNAVFLVFSCIVNLYYFACLPAATSLPLIAGLVRRSVKEKKPLCLLWIVPLVVCFADIVAAVLLWRREKNFSPPVVPPAVPSADQEAETAEESL